MANIPTPIPKLKLNDGEEGIRIFEMIADSVSRFFHTNGDFA
jgi:hypothetical protein